MTIFCGCGESRIEDVMCAVCGEYYRAGMSDNLFNELVESVKEGAVLMTEHDIQNAIIQLITMKGGIAIRVNSGSIVVRGERGTRVFRGAEKGTSDIIALYRRRFLAIEVKVPYKKPTPEQQAFLYNVRECGGIGMVAYCAADVHDVLEQIDGELIL